MGPQLASDVFNVSLSQISEEKFYRVTQGSRAMISPIRKLLSLTLHSYEDTGIS